MRARLGSPAAVVVAAAAAALAFAGCGGADGERGSAQGALIWKGTALTIPAGESLPNDRIVGGRVVNDSLKTIEVRARDMRLETADGRRLEVAALAFIDHYAHGIFPPSRRERLASNEEQDAEDRRLGRLVTLRPRKDAPLTIAWRQPAGAAKPVRVRYPGGSLPLPR